MCSGRLSTTSSTILHTAPLPLLACPQVLYGLLISGFIITQGQTTWTEFQAEILDAAGDAASGDAASGEADGPRSGGVLGDAIEKIDESFISEVCSFSSWP